jgi:hypothetical protein
MIIKFKLLEVKYSKNENFSEFYVSECTYNNQPINKIIFSLSHQEISSSMEKEVNESFIIKDVQENEIEPNNNTLKINSANSIITPVKTDFLFAVNQIEQINDEWEIELVFAHPWNGEKIKRIRLLDASSQYKKMIEINKNKHFFQISGIKKYDTFSLSGRTSKELIISETDFQELNTVIPWQINLKEIFVKNLKVLNNNNDKNTYLFDAQEILASQGLKDYEKIELVTSEKINKGETVSFTIPDLRVILRRDKEDKILRVGQDYYSLTKFQPGLETSVDDLAEKKIQNFLAKHQDDYWEKINVCQAIVKKTSFFLARVRHRIKTQNDLLEELINQQKELSHQLEIFVDQTKLQKKIATLKEKFLQNYQNSNQIDQLQEELDQINQEFLSLEKEIKYHDFSVDEYLQHNWVLVLRDDPQIQQLLTGYNLDQEKFLSSLNWQEVYPLLKEDGIDYSSLEKLIQKKKTYLDRLNDLGYKLTEIAPGEEYEKWHQAQVKKSEAIDAISFGYSPEQWKDPQYQEYKEIHRVLADSIIKVLHRKWIPPLNDVQKEKIKKDSWPAYKLIENIQAIQRENRLAYAKIYFKKFIDQELKKSPEPEPKINLMTYEKAIDKQYKWGELMSYVKQTTKEIKSVRNNKITSLEELKNLVKKNISETLTKSKLKTKDLHPQHRNWLSDIEKMESKSQITQHEQDLILLLEEINCLLRQNYFPNLDSQTKKQIKQVENVTELGEQVEILLVKRQNWLVTWQINLHLRHYRELQNEDQQNYHLQKKALNEARLLLDFFPNEEQDRAELKQNLLITFDKLSYLSDIKNLQRRFSEANSLEQKKTILQKLQNSFQEWAEKGKLNEKEAASREEVETKLRLVKQGKEVEKLSVLNERQMKLNLLNLPQEEPDENEIQTENDSSNWELSQQVLALLAVGSLILIFFWRWYRKKREEDPFW